jgi:hypothetical protein
MKGAFRVESTFLKKTLFTSPQRGRGRREAAGEGVVMARIF